MSDFPSRDDLIEIGIDTILTTPGSKITDGAVRREGSDANLLIASQSAMGEEVVRQLARVAAGLTLDTARGEALDRVVFDLPFPIQRKSASPALVDATFTRPSAAAGAGTIPAGYRFTLGGIGFQALNLVAVPAGALTATVQAQAETTGPAGNVAAGTTGTLVDSLFDTSFVPSAPTAAAGGADAEKDEALRSRARKAHEAARRGTLAAIEAGALSVDGVAHAKAYEVLDGDGNPAHVVELVISDGEGNSNAALQAAVQAVLDDYRPAGIVVTLLNGTQVLQTIQLQVTFLAGFDTVVAFEEAANRVLAAVNQLDPGQTLHVSEIISAAKGDGPAVTGIVDVKVIDPAGDVVPASNTLAIRTQRPLITLAA